MTKEEIKENVTMREVVERYGLEVNRAGFVSCPFHKGDRDPSMRIYKDSFHCFGCGADGDVFTFVRNMEHCDFRTAFEILGGTYSKPTAADRIARQVRKMQQASAMRKKQKERDERGKLLRQIEVVRERARSYEPLSDEWCDAIQELEDLKIKAGLYDV